jgi:hypothetical protein
MYEEAQQNLDQALKTSVAIGQRDNVLRARRLLQQLTPEKTGISQEKQDRSID